MYVCVVEEWCFEGWSLCMHVLWKSGVLKVGFCVTVVKAHRLKAGLNPLLVTDKWTLLADHFTGISSSEMCPWKERAVCSFWGAACSCSVSMGGGGGGGGASEEFDGV